MIGNGVGMMVYFCAMPFRAILLVIAFASGLAKNAIAEEDTYAHFILLVGEEVRVADVDLSYSGGDVAIRLGPDGTPGRRHPIAIPINRYIPGAWLNGFRVGLASNPDAYSHVRPSTGGMGRFSASEQEIDPPRIYISGEVLSPVPAHQLASHVGEHCNQTATTLGEERLLHMLSICRGLYSQALGLLGGSDTQTLRSFKGWFDASYNLWRRTYGVHLVDASLMDEYDKNIRRNVDGRRDIFTVGYIENYILEVDRTEVGYAYNEAARLEVAGFVSAAAELLCWSRNRFIALGLSANRPPHIGLHSHIDVALGRTGAGPESCSDTLQSTS